MIREFHDEISRLRQQLAEMMGGKGGSSGASGSASFAASMGSDEQDSYIKVENKEKMRAMEDTLEAEKKEMLKQFERQRQMISAKADIVEEEKVRLIEELEKRNDAEQREK